MNTDTSKAYFKCFWLFRLPVKRRRKKISSRASWDVSVNSNTAPSSRAGWCFFAGGFFVFFPSHSGCSASPQSPVFLNLNRDSKCTLTHHGTSSPHPQLPLAFIICLKLFFYFDISFSFLLIVKWLISVFVVFSFMGHQEGLHASVFQFTRETCCLCVNVIYLQLCNIRITKKKSHSVKLLWIWDCVIHIFAPYLWACVCVRVWEHASDAWVLFFNSQILDIIRHVDIWCFWLWTMAAADWLAQSWVQHWIHICSKGSCLFFLFFFKVILY